MNDHTATEPPEAEPAVGAQVDRRVRPRTCATCAHKDGWLMPTCMLSGYCTTTERKFPTVCGKDFAGWQQREPLLRRVQAWLYAA